MYSNNIYDIKPTTKQIKYAQYLAEKAGKHLENIPFTMVDYSHFIHEFKGCGNHLPDDYTNTFDLGDFN